MRTTCIVAIAMAAAMGSAPVRGETADVTVTLQQGVGGYDGCATIDPYKAPVKGQPARMDFNKLTLVFGKIALPGRNPKVTQARLLLHFREEGYTRIKTATLQMLDAARPDGPPLDTVRFSQPMPERVSKANRFLPWVLPAATVQKWLDDPASNKGVSFLAKPDQEGLFQFIFDWTGSDEPAKRPALEITYSFEGDVPPSLPRLKTSVDGKTLGPRFTVEWEPIRFDLRGLPCTYEVELSAGSNAWKMVASAPAEGLSADVNVPEAGQACRLRVSAVNTKGLRSEYAAAKGAFTSTADPLQISSADAVTKVQRETAAFSNPVRSVTLAAARNEYESFQIVVGAAGNVKDLDVVADDLQGPGGARIPAAECRLSRVHYVDCKGKGFLPDSMVPFVDPGTGGRIGGRYGAPFDVAGGFNAPVWCEVHVPSNAVPGVYRGAVHVRRGTGEAASIAVALTVHAVTLPKESSLLTYFELSQDTSDLIYLRELHAHRMDVWEVRGLGIGHAFERLAGKPVMKWNADYDRLIESYCDGTLFADGVPGKTWLLRRGAMTSGGVKDPLTASDEDRVEILRQYQEHYKDKPYAPRLAWFFIDEPKPETIKKCIAVGKQIREFSPALRFLLTTRYNPDLEGLVGIWDAIVNTEVIDWNAPGPDAYRGEMAKGRTAISCITVNSDTPTSPNVFIHRGGMNTRIWPWVTFALDLQGLELWDTRAAPSVLQPQRYGDAWGDGSLFYKGLPAELGVAKEMPLPSIRLKMLRATRWSRRHGTTTARSSRPSST